MEILTVIHSVPKPDAYFSPLAFNKRLIVW